MCSNVRGCSASACARAILADEIDPDELVERFQRGEEAAVRRLYRDYGSLVYTAALRVLGRRDLAEEATQEAFLRAFRSAASFDRSLPMAPWLATIAKRIAIDIQRREMRRAAGPLDETQNHPRIQFVLDASVMETVEATMRVRSAIDMLAPKEAEIVRLHHLEGLSYPEIGRKLGISEGTVKSRSFRAHRQLAALLADLRPDEPTAPARQAS